MEESDAKLLAELCRAGVEGAAATPSDRADVDEGLTDVGRDVKADSLLPELLRDDAVEAECRKSVVPDDRWPVLVRVLPTVLEAVVFERNSGNPLSEKEDESEGESVIGTDSVEEFGPGLELTDAAGRRDGRLRRAISSAKFF